MTIGKEKIEVITSVERRRRWSAEEKCSIIQETYLPRMSASLVARKYNISPSQLFTWRRLMENGALQGIHYQEDVVPKSHLKDLEKRIRELERLLGKKTLENEVLREAVKFAREKNLYRGNPCPEWKV